ncbi:MAG: CpsB/CapC family capsule biosynthesis tyrosine phosphatase [Wenzhouxiangella sp.]|jgi:protein-tyrosine phosphatase|nr:CpsB/CapC family capsule biosynthesis tyrosine phosphatase [Wenzhouxiangella sp.]
MFTDIHCHILPGIDDGSKELAQSLAMARIAIDDGIDTIFATPHHLNGVYTNPARAVLDHVERLREHLLDQGMALKVLPGAENHIVPELPDALAEGTAMTMGNLGQAVLVELPVHTVPVSTEEILENIRSQSLTPIIAHPERNTYLRQHPQRLREWIEMGCLAQVTAQSCTGLFGPQVRAAAHAMVTGGMIHFVASDAHRDRRRIPEISLGQAEIERWTNTETARLLAEDLPAQLAGGEPLDTQRLQAALPAPRQSWWQRVFHRSA